MFQTMWSKIGLLVLLLSCSGLQVVQAHADILTPETPESTTSAPTTPAVALQTQINDIKAAWAVAKYEAKGEEQAEDFEKLINSTTELVAQYPTHALPLLWKGTVLSTYASIKGGSGALSMVSAAREDLEAALAMDDTIEAGFGHAVLGALYYRVPGWPLSFKDNQLARVHLERALEINPSSVDANYYYGDFLVKLKQYDAAKSHLAIVLSTPATDIYVTGRKTEAQATLDKMPQHA